MVVEVINLKCYFQECKTNEKRMEEGNFGNTDTEGMAEGMRVPAGPTEMCVREEDSMRWWLSDGQEV